MQTQIAEGMAVAEYDGRGNDASVTITTITKLTKTQIVTATGRRFNRDRLREVGNPYGAQLRAVTDRQVRSSIANKKLDRLRYEIDQLLRNGPHDIDVAVEIIGQIEKLVDEARTTLIPTVEGSRSSDG